jgi:predicted GNAT family acetyltransferase
VVEVRLGSTEQHGRAALMGDRDNAAAIAVYRRLGYTYRRVAAAHLEYRWFAASGLAGPSG